MENVFETKPEQKTWGGNLKKQLNKELEKRTWMTKLQYWYIGVYNTIFWYSPLNGDKSEGCKPRNPSNLIKSASAGPYGIALKRY